MVAVTLAACAGTQTVQAGELIVAIDSDMSWPKDVDTLQVEVYAGGPGGEVMMRQPFSVPRDARLPATVAIAAGTNNVVDIRVLGLSSGGQKLRVLREAVTTVPTDRVATMRMPVAWLCYGQVTSVNGTFGSSCPTGQTCIAGACQTNAVNPTTLAVYKPADIFGGAQSVGTSGTCFDTVACFSQGYVPAVDMTACTVPAPTSGKGINVGLVTSGAGGVGICGTDSCYVPLDHSPDEGFSIQNGLIQLPSAVCDRLAKHQVLSVVVTTSCETKEPSIPTCGAWSSVTSMPGTVDAAAPEGAVPILDATMPEVVAEAAPPVDAAPAPDVAVEAAVVEAGPQPMLSCPNVWIGVDTTVCDPVKQTGCSQGMACNLVSASAVGCIPHNLVAADAGLTASSYWPCGTADGCPDGTYCNPNQVCAPFCCINTDCGGTGRICAQLSAPADGGAPEGGADGGAPVGKIGLCQ
jgi:hypothetical protein